MEPIWVETSVVRIEVFFMAGPGGIVKKTERVSVADARRLPDIGPVGQLSHHPCCHVRERDGPFQAFAVQRNVAGVPSLFVQDVRTAGDGPIQAAVHDDRLHSIFVFDDRLEPFHGQGEDYFGEKSGKKGHAVSRAHIAHGNESFDLLLLHFLHQEGGGVGNKGVGFSVALSAHAQALENGILIPQGLCDGRSVQGIAFQDRQIWVPELPSARIPHQNGDLVVLFKGFGQNGATRKTGGAQKKYFHSQGFDSHKDGPTEQRPLGANASKTVAGQFLSDAGQCLSFDAEMGGEMRQRHPIEQVGVLVYEIEVPLLGRVEEKSLDAVLLELQHLLGHQSAVAFQGRESLISFPDMVEG